MRAYSHFRRCIGFTLVELLIVIALVAIVLTLAAPSFREMIEMQRLKSIAAQVVTDVQFARSEAPNRQRYVYISFTPGEVASMTCYVIHTCPENIDCQCNCAAAVDQRCAGAQFSNIEIRTVQVPIALGVEVSTTAAQDSPVPNVLRFDPATGGMTAFELSLVLVNKLALGPAWVETSLIRGGNAAPSLRTDIGPTGRPSVCSPAGRVTGVPAC